MNPSVIQSLVQAHNRDLHRQAAAARRIRMPRRARRNGVTAPSAR
ncbi:MAG TPA: hypothetical protein VGI74_19080 [Streptosporangiaceae bacterium]|jgi:hypothetical protein